MEPYTGAFIWNTSKKEDPDRNFYEFNKQWKDIVMNEEKYNHELIPEYFYMPEVYANPNCVFLGFDEESGQSKEHVPILTDSFILP